MIFVNKTKSVAVALLTATVLSAAIIFHYPYSAADVCRAIPPGAVAATRHLKPAERIDRLLGSEFAQDLLRRLESDNPDIPETLQDPVVRKLVRIIGRRYLVTGYVPEFSSSGTPALIAAAWIGGYARLFEWGLLDNLFSDFVIRKSIDGGHIWICPCDDIKPGYFLFRKK